MGPDFERVQDVLRLTAHLCSVIFVVSEIHRHHLTNIDTGRVWGGANCCLLDLGKRGYPTEYCENWM